MNECYSYSFSYTALIILIVLVIILIILSILKINTKNKCEPCICENKTGLKTFEEEQKNPASVSDIFSGMFTQENIYW